jgi:hypothetical protein
VCAPHASCYEKQRYALAGTSLLEARLSP